LYHDLTIEFGSDSVFMDVAAIQPGRDFRKAIDQSLSSCGAFLSVIGKSWLTVKDSSGQRRLDDSADFVRVETAAALQRDIPVIPVLVQGASTPRPDQLPDNLKDLAYRNAIELSHPRWDSDVQLLIKALRPYVAKAPQQTGESNAPRGGAPSGDVNRADDRRSRAKLAALVAIIVAAAVGLTFSLWPARKIPVPDLQGQMLDPAIDVLHAEHLVLGTAERREQAGATPGSIVAQSVRAGEHVPVGTRIDLTVAAMPKGDSRLANSPLAALSKSVPPKKIAAPNSREKLSTEGTGSPAPNAANAPAMVDPNELTLLRQMQLSAERKPIEQQSTRYHFTLSLKVPEQTLTDISRVHYDLVYDPNPLSLEGGPSPSFSAAYEGWGCYSTVVVTVYLSTPGAQPFKKTFDMCTVLR
jgi:hypothetical protein